MAASIATSVTGMNTQQLVTDANSAATESTIKQIDSYAKAHYVVNAQFSGTPTLFLNKQLRSAEVLLRRLAESRGSRSRDQRRPQVAAPARSD